MITINDKAVGVHFGMLAVINFYEKYPKLKKGSKMTSNMLVDLVYFGVQNWYDRDEKECEITRGDVYDWLEIASLTDEGVEQIKNISKKFEDSQYIKTLATNQSKKKLTSKS